MKLLKRRLSALEIRNPPQHEVARPKTDYAALREMANAKSLERNEPPKPSGAAGVRHYREASVQREELARMTPPPDVPGQTNYAALRILFAKQDGGGTQHELRRCELEVLDAQGFDAVHLATWRDEHSSYNNIPWQWRGADLPAEALAVIDAALARAPETTGDMHDDTEAD